MPTSVATAADSKIELLTWDTGHLGCAVARIRAPRLTDAQLDAALADARDAGVTLVYWPAAPGARPEPGLLHCYRGTLVDRKAVFRAKLADLAQDAPHGPADELVITEAAAGPAPAKLSDLAVAAGRFSRFSVDPRIPRDKFESLYRLWLERSLRHELADTVLVAHRRTDPQSPLGMITLAVSGSEGTIGLIAVQAAVRGQGLGVRLLAAAHCGMNQCGASAASVVTQLANAPACRLYERAGYRLAEVTDYYHFWLRPVRLSAA